MKWAAATFLMVLMAACGGSKTRTAAVTAVVQQATMQPVLMTSPTPAPTTYVAAVTTALPTRLLGSSSEPGGPITFAQGRIFATRGRELLIAVLVTNTASTAHTFYVTAIAYDAQGNVAAYGQAFAIFSPDEQRLMQIAAGYSGGSVDHIDFDADGR